MVRKYGVDVIAIGNGTASKESEIFIANLLKEIPEAVGPLKKQTDLFSMETEEWMSGLVFERQGAFYDPILDFGWKESGDPAVQLSDPWKQLCQCLEVARG